MEVCNRSGRKRKLFTVVSAQLSNLYIFAIICMRERFPYFLRVKHLTDPSHLHDYKRPLGERSEPFLAAKRPISRHMKSDEGLF